MDEKTGERLFHGLGFMIKMARNDHNPDHEHLNDTLADGTISMVSRISEEERRDGQAREGCVATWYGRE